MLDRIHRYLSELTTTRFILVMTMLTFVVVMPLMPVYMLYEYHNLEVGGVDLIDEFNSLSPSLFVVLVILIVFIAPITETFVFQWLVIKIGWRLPYIGDRNRIIILISAVLFGWAHYYSMVYVVYTFIVGVLFAYSFILYEEKRKSPFWVVTAIHSLRNAISALAAVMGYFLDL